MVKGKTYSMKEVAEHDRRESCWIVLHDNVYDITAWLEEHPGGEDILLENAGKDATEEFETTGHSTDARTLMQEYLIGALADD